MAGSKRPESFWLGLVAEWRASGLPLSRFAKGRGVAPNSLGYWVTRGTKPLRLLKVEVAAPVEEVASAANVEVHLRGALLRLSTDVPAGWLAELIRCAGDA